MISAMPSSDRKATPAASGRSRRRVTALSQTYPRLDKLTSAQAAWARRNAFALESVTSGSTRQEPIEIADDEHDADRWCDGLGDADRLVDARGAGNRLGRSLDVTGHAEAGCARIDDPHRHRCAVGREASRVERGGDRSGDVDGEDLGTAAPDQLVVGER